MVSMSFIETIFTTTPLCSWGLATYFHVYFSFIYIYIYIKLLRATPKTNKLPEPSTLIWAITTQKHEATWNLGEAERWQPRTPWCRGQGRAMANGRRRAKERMARVENVFRNGRGRGPLSPSWSSPYTIGIWQIPPVVGRYPPIFSGGRLISWDLHIELVSYPGIQNEYLSISDCALGGSDAHPTPPFPRLSCSFLLGVCYFVLGFCKLRALGALIGSPEFLSLDCA